VEFKEAAESSLRAIAAISGNVSGGASELALEAIEALRGPMEALPEQPDRESGEILIGLAEAVYRAKPFMAPFVRTANRLCRIGEEIASESKGNAERPRGDFFEFAESIRSAQSRLAAVSTALRERLPEPPRILTFSRSSAVMTILTELAKDAAGLTVIAPEGRPGYEGRRIADELAGLSVEVTSITDGAACAYAGEADLILIGADSLSPAFAVNKIGSRGLALAANEAGTPYYVAAEQFKLIPEKLQIVDDAGHNPEEVWAPGRPGLRVENRYFERVPLGLVSAVISETGTLTMVEVETALREIRFSPRLYDWAKTTGG
jgi:translation initiation factor eIF-2B subunit delta